MDGRKIYRGVLSALLVINTSLSAFNFQAFGKDFPAKKHYIGAMAAAAVYLGHRAYESSCQKQYKAQPKKTIKEKKLSKDSPIKTIFAHGLGSTRFNGRSYHQAEFIMGHTSSHDFQDSPALFNIKKLSTPQGGSYKQRLQLEYTKLIARMQSCIGQNADIESLLLEYKQAVNAGYRVIFFGVSRGAATILNLMGLYDLENVIAIIVESPFDHIKNVVKHVLSRAGLQWIPGFTTLGTFICSCIHRNYSVYGVHPSDIVHKISKNIAVFFIGTQEDGLTPLSGTMNLYKQMRKLGHNKTHILVVKKGKHGQIIKGPCCDQYRHDVHGFLNHYGMPCIKKYAEQSTHPDFSKSCKKLAFSYNRTSSGVKR